MKKKFSILILSFGILLASIAFAADWEAKDLRTYFGYTSKQITIQWDGDVRSTSYEVRLLHVERNVYEPTLTTTETELTFGLPRTGHYIIEVRALNEFGESIWGTSEDPALFVDNQLEPFWIYGYPEPVGTIIIN